MKKHRAIIVDIDGVILQCPYWQDMEDFYKNLDQCVAVDWAVYLVNYIQQQGIKIIFLTARDEKCKIQTNIQLRQLFDFKYDLYMRKRGDLRIDWEIKQDYLKEIQEKYNVLFSIDDNASNCEMYRRNNIPSLQVR